jgi:hypothetical protein
LDTALLAAFQEEPRNLLDKQWHTASALRHAFDHFFRQGVPRCKLPDHVTNLIAVERS